VSNKIVSELAVGQVPDLDQAIPAGRNDQRDLLRRGEAYAGHPFCVPFRVSTDSVLALSKGIPEANSRITST